MSVLTNQTNINETSYQFIKSGGASTLTTVNPYASISVINTDQINIDGVRVDGSTASGGQLLVNGVAVATVNQNVSSIANWAQYPAVSSITFATGGGSGGAITMNTGNFSTLNVSSINGVLPQGSVYVDGNSYSSGGDISLPTSNVTVLVSTAASYTFVNGHAYTFSAPTSLTPVSYTGTGYFRLGIEPTAVFGGNSNVNRASITPYLNGQVYSQGLGLTQIINGNFYARSNFVSPLAVWAYVNPGGVANLLMSAGINAGSSDVLLIQDLGAQIEH
jgi:hypothetical protein